MNPRTGGHAAQATPPPLSGNRHIMVTKVVTLAANDREGFLKGFLGSLICILPPSFGGHVPAGVTETRYTRLLFTTFHPESRLECTWVCSLWYDPVRIGFTP